MRCETGYPYWVMAKMYQPSTHYSWLTQHGIGFSVIGQTYYFERGEDALLFSLVWG